MNRARAGSKQENARRVETPPASSQVKSRAIARSRQRRRASAKKSKRKATQNIKRQVGHTGSSPQRRSSGQGQPTRCCGAGSGRAQGAVCTCGLCSRSTQQVQRLVPGAGERGAEQHAWSSLVSRNGLPLVPGRFLDVALLLVIMQLVGRRIRLHLADFGSEHGLVGVVLEVGCQDDKEEDGD